MYTGRATKNTHQPVIDVAYASCSRRRSGFAKTPRSAATESRRRPRIPSVTVASMAVAEPDCNALDDPRKKLARSRVMLS